MFPGKFMGTLGQTLVEIHKYNSTEALLGRYISAFLNDCNNQQQNCRSYGAFSRRFFAISNISPLQDCTR